VHFEVDEKQIIPQTQCKGPSNIIRGRMGEEVVGVVVRMKVRYNKMRGTVTQGNVRVKYRYVTYRNAS